MLAVESDGGVAAARENGTKVEAPSKPRLSMEKARCTHGVGTCHVQQQSPVHRPWPYFPISEDEAAFVRLCSRCFNTIPGSLARRYVSFRLARSIVLRPN
jgi:hypothetical protein